MSDQQQDWISCREQMPPEGVQVDTKIEDYRGVRNEQSMYFLNGLWWIGEGRDAMYVYYNPTHWKGNQ